MKSKIGWNPSRLGAAAALGVLGFVFSAIISIPMNVVLGPFSALIMFIIGALLVVLVRYILPIFPSATIMALVWGVLALPTPALGPPGFILKPVIFIGAGISADLLMLVPSLHKKERLSSAVVGIVSMIAIAILIVVTSIILLPPNVSQKVVEKFSIMVITALIFGSIGGLAGLAIFNKIRNRSIVVRLRGE